MWVPIVDAVRKGVDRLQSKIIFLFILNNILLKVKWLILALIYLNGRSEKTFLCFSLKIQVYILLDPTRERALTYENSWN